MHSGDTMNNNYPTTNMGLPIPQAGEIHYALVETKCPQPTRRVIVSILEPIEEMEEPVPEHSTPTPEQVPCIPTTTTRDTNPQSDTNNDSSNETASNESGSDNEHRVRRVRFAEEVTIIPKSVGRHVHWPADSELVTFIPDAEYSEEAPVKKVRFAASPDLVTYIPNDSSVDGDYDSDENNNNNNPSEHGSPAIRVQFAAEPVVRRSTQVNTLYDIEAGEEVPRPGSAYIYPRLLSVIDRTPTPTAHVPLALLGSAQVQEEQDVVETVWDGQVPSGGSRDASELDRTETHEDFVHLATHSKKRKRRMRRAFAGVAARLSKIVTKEKRQRAIDDVYCWA